MADTPDLKSGEVTRTGSSPVFGTGIVVFPVKRGAVNPELTMAIRTISYNYPHTRIVLLTEQQPLDLRNVEIIMVKRSGTKYPDTYKKILTAAKILKEDFALWNDDMYAVRPADPTVTYTRGPANDVISRFDGTHRAASSYMRRTLAMLEEQGVPGPYYAYNVHMPMPLRWELLIEVYARFQILERVRTSTFDVRTLYGNVQGVHGTSVPDCKIFNTRPQSIDRALSDLHPYLSSSDRSFHGPLKHWLNDRFPIPSPYEREHQIGKVSKRNLRT